MNNNAEHPNPEQRDEAYPTDTIQANAIRSGTALIDTHHHKTRVIRKLVPHDSFVELLFEDEEETYTYSTDELQTRFQVAPNAFQTDPKLVTLVAEARRLQHAYLFNPIFATETSLIDPLPHQFIAVYQHLLKHAPLRFLLADDAGAGKTIMTGLYIQELLLRGQVERILVVPPAGLIGNWERELRLCFRLNFRILSSNDANRTNPFAEPKNRLAIISLDTLRQERMQKHLFNAPDYQLVVFDEAHKLSARYERDGTIHKSKRYLLAERIAAQRKHLLLLTATPHMGKEDAYYFLWRLLMPERLAAQKAFERLATDEKTKHLLRRMKEEMITFDGKPIYPPRHSRTITYPLKQGPVSEQALYDAVTTYCEQYFDLANQYNRNAAKMAMLVLQRRLASSTFALRQSIIRRTQKLHATLQNLRNGNLSTAQLETRQQTLSHTDVREEKTGDEEEFIDGTEESEHADRELERATTAQSTQQLETEIQHLQTIKALAENVYRLKSESKFEKLWEALSEYPDTKVLIFTEHRDTLEFVTHRLEALGFTGKVAQIHGGMNYTEREKQVERFRDTHDAQYLIATDAAGEGINLQFCWLMVNYDIPWNPARLEQRMGRIHRYKQTHTVVLLNLVAEDTREGRVLTVLLDKLQKMRDELDDDKVFDVIGQQFSQTSLSQLITKAITENQTDASIRAINEQFTAENFKTQLERQQKSVMPSDIKHLLADTQHQREAAETFRMLPAYARSFFEQAAQHLGAHIKGSTEHTFKLVNSPAPLQNAIDEYPPNLQHHLTFSRQLALPNTAEKPEAILLHPGEPIFDTVQTHFLQKFNAAAKHGAIFFDPHTEEPYLFYLAKVNIVQQTGETSQILDQTLLGIKQTADAKCSETPAHLLLTLIPPTAEQNTATLLTPELHSLAEQTQRVKDCIRENFGNPKLLQFRNQFQNGLKNRQEQLQVSFNLQRSELLKQRQTLKTDVNSGTPAAQTKLERCNRLLKTLPEEHEAAKARLTQEIETIRLEPVELYARAFVTPPPPDEPGLPTRTLPDTEAIAINTVINYERQRGATVQDVSAPHLKRGFDLESRHPNGEVRYIEVKGRATTGDIQLTENEWRQADNHPDRYWLYVVYHCDSNPQLHIHADPYNHLKAKCKATYIIKSADILNNTQNKKN